MGWEPERLTNSTGESRRKASLGNTDDIPNIFPIKLTPVWPKKEKERKETKKKTKRKRSKVEGPTALPGGVAEET